MVCERAARSARGFLRVRWARASAPPGGTGRRRFGAPGATPSIGKERPPANQSTPLPFSRGQAFAIHGQLDSAVLEIDDVHP